MKTNMSLLSLILISHVTYAVSDLKAIRPCLDFLGEYGAYMRSVATYQDEYRESIWEGLPNFLPLRDADGSMTGFYIVENEGVRYYPLPPRTAAEKAPVDVKLGALPPRISRNLEVKLPSGKPLLLRASIELREKGTGKNETMYFQLFAPKSPPAKGITQQRGEPVALKESDATLENVINPILDGMDVRFDERSKIAINSISHRDSEALKKATEGGFWSPDEMAGRVTRLAEKSNTDRKKEVEKLIETYLAGLGRCEGVGLSQGLTTKIEKLKKLIGGRDPVSIARKHSKSPYEATYVESAPGVYTYKTQKADSTEKSYVVGDPSKDSHK